MKKLIMLGIILLVSTTSHSQNGSEAYPKLLSDGTTALTPDQVASINVYRTECDFNVKELNETKILVEQKKQEVAVRDKEIEGKAEQIALQKELTDSKKDQIEILKDQIKTMNLNKLGNKLLLWGSIALNIFLGIKLL